MKEHIFIKHLKLDRPEEIQLDGQVPWLNKILDELNEDADDTDREKFSDSLEIYFKGEFLLKNNGKLGDYVLLDGSLFASFVTLCVSTGTVMNDVVDCSLSIVFIDDVLKDKLGLEEETDFFIDNEERDLYYYDNNKIDIRSTLHENVFLHKNPYPKLEP